MRWDLRKQSLGETFASMPRLAIACVDIASETWNFRSYSYCMSGFRADTLLWTKLQGNLWFSLNHHESQAIFVICKREETGRRTGFAKAHCKVVQDIDDPTVVIGVAI